MRDRRAERHAATRAEILDAAWTQVREHGLAALSLRDLARSVGMRAPSLYSYFDSKNAIYDAMYAQAAQQFVDEQQAALPLPDDPVEALKTMLRFFVEFCAADIARYQLVFQRTIPGFEPSPESFRISQENLAEVAERLARCGVDDPEMLDLFTALGTGLTDQQLSNDPGGDRWIRLIDDAAEMFHDHLTKRAQKADQEATAPSRKGTGRSKGRRAG
ncbi:TetR/AcrR family transcriptional regulator [Rhabdothermincola salaria]|uniref:TetR/AcrR family transcriptional regulator n=1 Tax=Rhabdothermincola salaria TaxID=2903142 RepID=UPI001E5305EF|nr:TetR/AcrR family transcriptional regulator [Rhabdothermincola salaria]